jgi:hypothetical protein
MKWPVLDLHGVHRGSVQEELRSSREDLERRQGYCAEGQLVCTTVLAWWL